MRTRHEHHSSPWTAPIAGGAILVAVAALGFALAVSGLARWLFVLVVATAAVTALGEGRAAARARAQAAALTRTPEAVRSRGLMTLLFDR